MKTKHYLLLALVGLTAFLVGLFIGKDRAGKPPGNVTETKETTVDTLPYFLPTPKSELTVGTRTYTLPIYRSIGGGFGGEPRCSQATDSICVDSLNTTATYGTGAGGEPRCTRDSAIVELPIVQRHYADSTYEAWVSGPVDPRLDSVIVFRPTTTITRREWKPPKRWSLGISAGYAFTPRGFQPYIGIGISYSLYSWK